MLNKHSVNAPRWECMGGGFPSFCSKVCASLIFSVNGGLLLEVFPFSTSWAVAELCVTKGSCFGDPSLLTLGWDAGPNTDARLNAHQFFQGLETSTCGILLFLAFIFVLLYYSRYERCKGRAVHRVVQLPHCSYFVLYVHTYCFTESRRCLKTLSTWHRMPVLIGIKSINSAFCHYFLLFLQLFTLELSESARSRLIC